jgi:hypothetical protein
MTNIAFYFSVYHDEVWAIRLASQIREHYGSSVPIIVVTDGPCISSRAHVGLARRGCDVHIADQRLKNQLGGAFTQRWVSYVRSKLDNKEIDYIIKVDPDSYIHRSFKDYPKADWFGQLFWSKQAGVNACHGGCWGMSYAALSLLDESQLLSSDVIKDVKYTYRRRKKIGDRQVGVMSTTTEDNALAWCFKELGVIATQWDEVSLKKVEWDELTSYAVTHYDRHHW